MSSASKVQPVIDSPCAHASGRPGQGRSSGRSPPAGRTRGVPRRNHGGPRRPGWPARGVAASTEPATDRLQRAITAESQTDLVVADKLVHRLLRPQLDVTAARITAGVQAGQAGESVNPQLAAEFLFGPVVHRWLLRTGPLDDEFADGVLAMVLAGLRPR
ncbi:TetR-like C-terminal domain-containing protein [Nesterenkonia suensis]